MSAQKEAMLVHCHNYGGVRCLQYMCSSSEASLVIARQALTALFGLSAQGILVSVTTSCHSPFL